MIQIHFIPTQGSEKDLASAAILTTVLEESLISTAIFSGALEVTRELHLPMNSRWISSEGEATFCGIDLKERKIRKGSLIYVEAWLQECGAEVAPQLKELVAEIERRGHQAIVVADQVKDLGVIEVILHGSAKSLVLNSDGVRGEAPSESKDQKYSSFI